MPRFRIENLREEDDKSEHTWWEKAQERFWEWWIYGRPSSKIRIKKLKLKSYRVPALYIGFVKGEITKEDLYDRLRPTQVGEFIALHELVKQGLETGKADIPPELAIALAESFMDRRRLTFALIQIDTAIEDMEREVTKRSGDTNIVRRDA